MLSERYSTVLYVTIPADTRRWINVGLTLVHRLRRWTNVKPTLIQRLVSAGIHSSNVSQPGNARCRTKDDLMLGQCFVPDGNRLLARVCACTVCLIKTVRRCSLCGVLLLRKDYCMRVRWTCWLGWAGHTRILPFWHDKQLYHDFIRSRTLERMSTIYSFCFISLCVGRGALVQWLKLPAWKFGSFKKTKCFFPANS